MMVRPHIRERLRTLMGFHESPGRIALTFSIGLFIGISPLIGLHTVLALALAWAFRLNRFAILTGVFVTNPWSIVPIYAFCTWVGVLVLNVEGIEVRVAWGDLTAASAPAVLGELLLPFVVGTLLVATVASIAAFFVIREAVRRARSGQRLPEVPGPGGCP
jgi:hypothetical protein